MLIASLFQGKMIQYLPDDSRMFYAGDNSHRTLALFAGFDIDMGYRIVGQGREQVRKL